jgi:hypothetical protein
VREKAESLGVISSASQKAEMRGEDAVPKKLKAPDKDTMMVTVPVRKDGPMKRDRSSSIGPIWNDSADRSTSKEDSQVEWTLPSLSCLLGGCALPFEKCIIVGARGIVAELAACTQEACPQRLCC